MALMRSLPPRIDAEAVEKFQRGQYYQDPEARLLAELGKESDETGLIRTAVVQPPKPPEIHPFLRPVQVESRPKVDPEAEKIAAKARIEARRRADEAFLGISSDAPEVPVVPPSPAPRHAAQPTPTPAAPAVTPAAPTGFDPTVQQPITLIPDPEPEPPAPIEYGFDGICWARTVNIGGVKVRYFDVSEGEFPGRRYALTDVLKRLDNNSAVRWAAPGEEPTTIWVTDLESPKRVRAQAVTMRIVLKTIFASRGFNAAQLQEAVSEQLANHAF